MELLTNNALTAISYGAVGCVGGAMAAANVFLVGAGASAKASAYVADYFRNESVAQNLRIKGDHLIGLAGKYAAIELKLAAALAAVGGSAALTYRAMDNEVPGNKDNIVFNPIKPDENLVKPEGKSENPLDTKNEKLPKDFPGKVNEVVPPPNVQPIGKFQFCVGPNNPYCLKNQNEPYFLEVFDEPESSSQNFSSLFLVFASSLLATAVSYSRKNF